MAKVDVIMPQMGESIAEIPAPNAGVLAEILVQEGQTVSVQTVVARIETDAGVASSEKPVRPEGTQPDRPRPAAPSPGAPAPAKPAAPADAPPAPLAAAPAPPPK